MISDLQPDNTMSQLSASLGLSDDAEVEQNSLFSQILGALDEDGELGTSTLLNSSDLDTSDNLLKIVTPNSNTNKQLTNITQTTDVKESKTITLESLLNGSDSLDDDVSKLFNTEVTNTLSSQELKQLAVQAKQYLKDKIQSSPDFKKSEVKELPKTLGGLVDMAKKFDIDVTKITVEDVQQKDTKNIDTLLTKPLKNEEKTSSSKEKVPNLLETKKELPTKTTLFKPTQTTNITTQELVATKQTQQIQQPNKQKTKTDDNLKLLLQGESVLKQDKTMTADFSVATAKVIAPQKTAIDSLESLLNDDKDKESSTSHVKNEIQPQTLKADDLEVKVKEAKQMTKYLSQDVKQAIDDYKAPFSRVKIQLNPKNLGDVDLTIVQRGKNLHVNITSNNTAINTLAMNVNDLKVQLQNSGINNATLNFSNSSEQGFNSQQNQQQNRQNAKQEYMYFDNEEQNEEVLSSLEIVLPHYV